MEEHNVKFRQMTVKQIVDSILQKQELFLCGLVSTERDRVVAGLVQTVQDVQTGRDVQTAHDAQVQQSGSKTLQKIRTKAQREVGMDSITCQGFSMYAPLNCASKIKDAVYTAT